jgi:hypothetical protein
LGLLGHDDELMLADNHFNPSERKNFRYFLFFVGSDEIIALCTCKEESFFFVTRRGSYSLLFSSGPEQQWILTIRQL